MTLPAKEQYQPRSAASSTRRGAEKQWRITGDAVGAGVEGLEDLVGRRRLALGVAGVDHDRQVELAGDLDLRREGAALVRRARGVAVVVEPGLADRPHLLVAGEPGDLRRRARRRSSAAEFGWRPTAAKTSSWRSAAAIAGGVGVARRCRR